MSSDLDPHDTITAVATAPGSGARGLVRLSGPGAFQIALSGFAVGQGDGPTAVPIARPPQARMRRGFLVLDDLRPRLPASLTLWPGPRTYTGQDVAEIHTVGSPPLLGLVLSQCLARGARHARPGEFTLRAFLHGRIDLTRAEAVLGVIDAHSPAQLDAALRQLAGGISRPILAVRDRLLDLVAHLEANLDFVDEHDVDPLGEALLGEELLALSAELAALAARLSGRHRPAGEPRVVLMGPPNVGKSRLFNALLGEDHAIVSPRPGTTRDYLAARCRCGGIMIELIDTAGIEPPRGAIERQAQSQRGDQARQADLVLLCSPGAAAMTPGQGPGLEPELTTSPRVIRVRTKCDLVPADARESASIATSAVTGAGLGGLRAAIAAALQSIAVEGDYPAATAARCRDSLTRAGESLFSAADVLRTGGGQELVAFELRLAIDELGKVVGAVVTDDILDRIFQRFCIGK